MKNVFLTLCVVLVFISACNTQKEAASSKAHSSVQKSPFSLSVVPETSQGEASVAALKWPMTKPVTYCTYQCLFADAGRVGTLE
jgi:hypothetical protein